MDLNLRGRTALITGASKGIGRGSAEVLAEEGVNVILVARTKTDLDAVRDTIASRWNVRAEVHALDISDSANVDRLAALHPDIDILVNNAGAIPGGNLQEIDEARWREAWDLKVFGYINMCRRFYALMQQRRHGVIINILGMAGERMDAELYRGLRRQCRTDGVHQDAGWRRIRRQSARRRHQPRRHRDRPAGDDHEAARAGPAGRRQPLGGAEEAPCPSAAPARRRKSAGWWPSSRPTSRPIPAARSSPSTAAPPIAVRCSETRSSA